ncbi:MAG: hypothetical protein HUJ92_04985 [Bacteroidales bacterium]|nr:hypothetical protein [Bacteroidales bacterium]
MKYPYPKDPLGLLSIFASLCYSLLSLVYIWRIPEFALWERIVFLLCFVGFPVGLVWLSYHLIVKHTKKLYPPSEFSNRENCYEEPMSKEEQEQKEKEKLASVKSSKFSYKEIGHLEGTIIKEMKELMNLNLQRNMRFGNGSSDLCFDAIDSSKSMKYFLEIKYLNDLSGVNDIRKRIEYIAEKLEKMMSNPDFVLVVVLVIPDTINRADIFIESNPHLLFFYKTANEIFES